MHEESDLDYAALVLKMAYAEAEHLVAKQSSETDATLRILKRLLVRLSLKYSRIFKKNSSEESVYINFQHSAVFYRTPPSLISFNCSK